MLEHVHEGPYIADLPAARLPPVLCPASEALVYIESAGQKIVLCGVTFDGGADAWAAEVAYFVDCVQNQRTPVIGTPAQARLGVAMANAARASLESGQVIAVAA